jgi:hypothetical protein
MNDLPEAAYTLMTYRRPLIMGLPTGGCLCTNDLPEAADNGLHTGGCLYINDLPEAAKNGLPTGGCLDILITM